MRKRTVRKNKRNTTKEFALCFSSHINHRPLICISQPENRNSNAKFNYHFQRECRKLKGEECRSPAETIEFLRSNESLIDAIYFKSMHKGTGKINYGQLLSLWKKAFSKDL